jgi:ubiquinone/menaquinone biosynthesis C-methylase UbiE
MLRSIFLRWRSHFRQRRFQKIQQLMRSEHVEGLILDLGGGPASFFAERFPHPAQIVLLEIEGKLALHAQRKLPALHVVVANGECLPFADQSISLTVCNSVIEHVEHPDQLAQEIERTSSAYFVQTPNGDFPIETHSIVGIPFYNYVQSKRVKRFLCRLFGGNFEYVESVRYLKESQLRKLFPAAETAYETALGLTKSYYLYCIGKNG